MPYCQGITQCKNDGRLSPACQYEPAQRMCVLHNRTPTMEVLVVCKLPSHHWASYARQLTQHNRQGQAILGWQIQPFRKK